MDLPLGVFLCQIAERKKGALYISQRKGQRIVFPYIKAYEADQHSFYRLPKELIKNPIFKNVSTDAKLLYGLLLDRMGLSIKNKWVDSNGNVFIYYTLDEIQEDMNCGHGKAVRLLAELDSVKGIGLIERKKQGQGKPTIIFVKHFIIPGDIQTSQKRKSRLPTLRSPEFPKSNANNTDLNEPDFIETDSLPSFQRNGLEKKESGGNDKNIYGLLFEQVKQQIEYDNLAQRKEIDQDSLLELMQIMVEVLASNSRCLFVDGDMRPIEQVKEQYRKIDSEVIQHVLDCLAENTTNVKNVKSYLRTCLYNAPTTMATQIKMQVNYDMTKGNAFSP